MKKVPLERFIAAIIDSIIISIISSVPAVFFYASRGFDQFINYLTESTIAETVQSDTINFLVFTTFYQLIIIFIWFVVIPARSNGQTVGKKILKIKAIDEFGKNPTLMQHFKRSVQNWSAYASAPFVFLLYVNIILFSVISGVLGFIVGALVFAAYVMLLIREDGRGLHDLWADTRVVKVDYDIDKEFVEKTALMGEWANVTADESLEEDEWNKKIDDENEEKDPWDE
jgi:uncharacterized RDD family membrane protein YckC